MRYRRLGRWGIQVSELALGTWLTHGRPAGETSAVAHTRRAYTLGVNLFDTANVYPEGNEGEAERVLGRALTVFPRDSYLVATKVFAPMGDGPLRRGLSRKHIMAQVGGSLRRLDMDHIDLYQCHRFDQETPLDETAEAMNDLIRCGKVVYWGVSEWSADQVEQVVALCRERNWALPVSNQLHYSALWREHEAEALPACQALGVGVLAFAPLAHGVLSGKYRRNATTPVGSRASRTADRWMFDRYFTDDVLRAVNEFCRLVEKSGCSPSQVAIAWCLRNSVVSSVVVGASDLGQLEENIATSGHGIDDEVLAGADKILDAARLA